MLAILDSIIEINTIYWTFAKELGFFIGITHIGAQKIDGIMLNTNEMVIAVFLVTNQRNQIKFFKKTFLVANFSPKIVFGMLFLTLNSADIDFLD